MEQRFVLSNFVSSRMGRHLTGRGVDASGAEVLGAVVQIEYHGQGQAIRRATFDAFETTNGGGMFHLRHVGVDVSFVAHAVAPIDLPRSAKRFKRTAHETELDNIN